MNITFIIATGCIGVPTVADRTGVNGTWLIASATSMLTIAFLNAD
jgi:hypothetical protein